MSIFHRISSSKEIKQAIAALEQAEAELGNNMSFSLIGDFLRKDLYNRPKEAARAIKEAGSAIQWAFIVIANMAGDLLESGNLHLYRGVLNPNGPGPDILRIYNKSLNKLVEYKSITNAQATAEKDAMAGIIRNIG